MLSIMKEELRLRKKILNGFRKRLPPGGKTLGLQHPLVSGNLVPGHLCDYLLIFALYSVIRKVRIRLFYGETMPQEMHKSPNSGDAALAALSCGKKLQG